MVSIAGFAVVVVWLSIPIAQIRFRQEWLKEHQEEELAFKTPFSPFLPYITIVLLVLSVVGIAWDKSQRAGLYFGLPLLVFAIYIISFVIVDFRSISWENLKICLMSKKLLF